MLVYGPRFRRTVASAKKSTINPIASPIPNIGVNAASVVDIEINPAEADVPTVEIPAKTGMTMKITSKLSRMNSGRVMTSSDMVVLQLWSQLPQHCCQSKEQDNQSDSQPDAKYRSESRKGRRH